MDPKDHPRGSWEGEWQMGASLQGDGSSWSAEKVPDQIGSPCPDAGGAFSSLSNINTPLLPPPT